MYWADKLAREIVDSGKYKPYWVDDMKTPSGFAHVGSLRGPIIHSLIFRAIRDITKEVKFTFVFNDFDPADELPAEFKEQLSSHLGEPLKLISFKKDGFKNLGDFLANDLKKVMEELGVEADYVSSFDMYKEGKFDEVIRIALDNAEKVQDIYQKVSGSKKKEKGWLPFQPICEKCGKLGTTRVFAWDGEKVAYKCEAEMVKWAKGCGYDGKVSPFGGTGKLPWKVDWAAHWKVMGITIEGAGKDHSTAGGSYDIAMALCKIFGIDKPYKLPYEFFLLGGKKMSSSKGVGLKAHDLTKILPASVARFLFARTDYRQTLEFNPVGTQAIPDLFDEYDRAWEDYNKNEKTDLARVFEISQIKGVPKRNPRLFIPRFRDIVNYKQLPNIDLWKKFEEMKDAKLTEEEVDIFKEREKYASIWLGGYAPDDMQMQMSIELPPEVSKLTDQQRDYLGKVIPLVERINSPEKLQIELFNLVKTMDMHSLDAFAAIYLSFLGKERGPRAAWFLLQYPKERVIERIELVLSGGEKIDGIGKDDVTKIDSKGYTISNEVKEKFPGVSFAYTIIRGVKIEKMHDDLERLKKQVANGRGKTTMDEVGEVEAIKVYRQMFRATGIDFHSRRPSPEALIRRLVQGKDLYTINTAVDAYNLAVIETGVGLGGFDYKKISEPVVLRFSEKDEEMHLLGDEGVTKTKSGELVYADKEKLLTLDLNYRDIDKTKITNDTTDIILFADGGPGFDTGKVRDALKLGADYILQFCGGKMDEIRIIK